MIPLTQSAYGVSFNVKVHPKARKNAVTGIVGDALKLSLTTPPVEGRANQACIEFFSELFKVTRTSVTIAAGEKSRNKVVRLTGVPAETISRKIQALLQEQS